MSENKIVTGMREAVRHARGEYAPGQKIRHGMVTVEITAAGPRLYIGDVLVRSWIGCEHDAEADALGREIGDTIWSAAIPD